MYEKLIEYNETCPCGSGKEI
ncbi:MAG: SEC-C domain-containing protein [Lachnospiraceae bacterium]|nr:SEC-C domain-containing protein [Lachnospiraceae bacterium]MBR4058683.1 SEC-C domain-containing protein [Lachnospiraceae bacterium]